MNGWLATAFVCAAGVVGVIFGLLIAKPQLRPLEPGERIAVGMDDGDAVALDTVIPWVLDREAHDRLRALQRRYRDARFRLTMEVGAREY